MTGFDPAAAELQGQVNDLRSELAEAEGSERWAIRSLAEVANALKEALGEDWAEHGEGNLAAGVTLLARQCEMAERSGAVKALRAEAQRFRYAAVGRPASPRSLHAQEIEERADRIESGQVTS